MDMDNELKEALEIVLDFDITEFEYVYENSRMGCLFETIEEPRRLKWAFNCLSKQFGWGKTFCIKKHGDRGFAVDDETYYSDLPDVVKVE